MDGPDGVSIEPGPAAGLAPWPGSPGAMQGYSWGVWGFFCIGALLGRFGRCYSSRAPDAGTLAGTFGGSPEEQVERSNPAPAQRRPWPSRPSSVVVRLPHPQGRRAGVLVFF